MSTFQAIVDRVTHHTDSPPQGTGQIAQRLLDAAQADSGTGLQRSGAALQGLTNADASQPLKHYGFNEVVH